MIRIVIFLLALAVAAAGFAWVADRPGDVAVTWLGYRIETSIMVALLAVATVAVVAAVVWSLIRAIWRTPEQVSLFMRHRRAVRGYLAISKGLVAIGSGDAVLARKSAADAARLSPGDPLALLLAAQSAQLGGDRAGAENAFRAMLERPDTKLLGLRGLYVEAQRRNDQNAARMFAEEAAATGPDAGWAGQAVLDYRCQAADWSGALAALDAMKGALDKAAFRRKRAVLLTAEALALADRDRDSAMALALDAVKLAPDLVPAAAYAGRRLAEAGNARRARKVLERAWIANPHPDIASAYADVRPGDSARERLARIRKLADLAPANPESALAIAQAALDAREFAAARDALTPLIATPTRRVALMMSDIEQAEHGDVGRAREWTARAVRAAPDPAWAADGIVSDRWRPVSPASGTLDAFQWKVPLAEIGFDRPVIDVAELAAAPAAAEPRPPAGEPPAEPAPPKPAPASRPAPPVETVMPIIHAPDDPGTDSQPDPELAAAPQPARGAWARIRQFFQ